jgi:hypothetical protein
MRSCINVVKANIFFMAIMTIFLQLFFSTFISIISPESKILSVAYCDITGADITGGQGIRLAKVISSFNGLSQLPKSSISAPWKRFTVVRKNDNQQNDNQLKISQLSAVISDNNNTLKNLKVKNSITPKATNKSFGLIRGDSTLITPLPANFKFQLQLQHHRFNRVNCRLFVEAKNSTGILSNKTVIASNSRGSLSFTTKSADLYNIGVSSQKCAFTILNANAPVGLLATSDTGASLHKYQDQFFLLSPENSIVLELLGTSREGASLSVYDALNSLKGRFSTSPQTTIIQNSFTGAGAVWKIQSALAQNLVLEDFTVRVVSGGLPLVFGSESIAKSFQELVLLNGKNIDNNNYNSVKPTVTPTPKQLNNLVPTATPLSLPTTAPTVNQTIPTVVPTTTFVSTIQTGELPPFADMLNGKEKWRVLVDKVLQTGSTIKTEEWMVQTTAEAGFNVLSPRWRAEKLDEVEQIAKWSKKHGIYYLPWLRGSIPVPNGTVATGHRLVWGNGEERALWSPNSVEYWNELEKMLIPYARLSLTHPSLFGVFFDYENYDRGGDRWNLFWLSYDDVILNKFANAKNVTIPELPLKERKNWLTNNKLHDEFEQFQYNNWKNSAAQLKRKIINIAPKFLFVAYPSPGAPFFTKAIYSAWSTSESPLILADPGSYGRSSLISNIADSVQENKHIINNRRKEIIATGAPYRIIGGIDPIVKGADPEFSGKNAVGLAESTEGYWIFYEGPKFGQPDHRAYWKWFTWANNVIKRNEYFRQYEDRVDPYSWLPDYLDAPDSYSANYITEQAVAGTKFESDRMRGDNIIVVGGNGGDTVKFKLRHLPIKSFKGNLSWDLRSRTGEKIQGGTVQYDSTKDIEVTLPSSGSYFLGLAGQQNGYTVATEDIRGGMYCGVKIGCSFFKDNARLRTSNSENTPFTIVAKGTPAELVKIEVRDVSTGTKIIEEKLTSSKTTVTLKIENTGTLEILTSPVNSVFEDYKLEVKRPNVSIPLLFIGQ